MVSARGGVCGDEPQGGLRTAEARRPDSGFARVWREAQEEGRYAVRSAAWERAVDGMELPIFRRGVQVGTRRTYDNRLLAALLRAQWRAQGKGDGWHGWSK